MKKDTNAQEGLGGYLQSMARATKEGLYQGLTTCSTFIDRYDCIWNMAKSGIFHKYRRTTENQKRKANEKSSDYKAPDSAARLFTQSETKKRKASHTQKSPMRVNEELSQIKDTSLSPLIKTVLRKNTSPVYYGSQIKSKSSGKSKPLSKGNVSGIKRRLDGFKTTIHKSLEVIDCQHLFTVLLQLIALLLL